MCVCVYVSVFVGVWPKVSHPRCPPVCFSPRVSFLLLFLSTFRSFLLSYFSFSFAPPSQFLLRSTPQARPVPYLTTQVPCTRVSLPAITAGRVHTVCVMCSESMCPSRTDGWVVRGVRPCGRVASIGYWTQCTGCLIASHSIKPGSHCTRDALRPCAFVTVPRRCACYLHPQAQHTALAA